MLKKKGDGRIKGDSEQPQRRQKSLHADLRSATPSVVKLHPLPPTTQEWRVIQSES
jgi:hypothetical protein